MNRIFGSLVALSSMFILTGCPLMLAQGVPSLRIVHLSPDAPAVQVCVDGEPFVVRLAFEGTSLYRPLPPDKNSDGYAINVLPFPSHCDDAGVIEAQLDFAPRSDTTIVAIDTLANIQPLVLNDDNSAPAAGNARFRLVHASPDAPTVDITLPDGTPVGGGNDLSFGDASDYVELGARTVNWQVRTADGATTVLDFAAIDLEPGEIYTFFVTNTLDNLNVIVLADNTGETFDL